MADNGLERFANDLHQEVLTNSGAGLDDPDDSPKQLREEMFTEGVLSLLTEHNEVNNWEICGYEAKSSGSIPAAKLNAWSLSGDGATLDLFVCFYNGTGKVVDVGKPEVRRHFELLIGFLRRALSGFHKKMEEASPAFAVAQKVHEAKDSLASVRLFFITDGVARSLDVLQESIPGVDLTYIAWDLEKLSRLRVGERGVIELDFAEEYDGSIDCLESTIHKNEYKTILAFFPATLLAKIYGQYGQRLLERNVRAYLQAKGKINKGLQSTLRDEPHRFLAYNNGLCCTAADAFFDKRAQGNTRLRRVVDFQIVNGGQTTASIYHAIKKEKLDLSAVTVQVKLTILKDPEHSAEIVPMISRYANSQNKINAADFAANGKFHRDLEQLSRTVWAPASSGMERGTHWYYERARGSYLDDKARQGTPSRQSAWATQNPPQQKFTKTDLAKFEHAWFGSPYLVCRGAEKNFEAFATRLEDDGEPLVDDELFRHVVARSILWKAAERIFDQSALIGYRANTVAYAVARIGYESEQRIDLPKIWADQRVPARTLAALTKTCLLAYSHLTNAEGNIGEWSKKPSCWEGFRDMELKLGTAWVEEWSEESFATRLGDGGSAEAEWEAIRHQFLDDDRSIGELEQLTGVLWISARRNDDVSYYAKLSYGSLRGPGGRKLRNLHSLVALFAAAAKLPYV